MYKLISQNKKDYLPLLLEADEQESMIDKYLQRGDLWVEFINEQAVCVCVVTQEGPQTLEIKNLAVSPQFQRKGHGKRMVEHIERTYLATYSTLIVGTGESPLTLPFYMACGFSHSHRIKSFFTDNYDHPIVEEGVLLVDMVYLKKQIQKPSPS